jgi:cytochrome c biogenesis protein
MKLLKLQNSLKLFTNLKFAIGILALIAVLSSVGSLIEQDENLSFYEKNYPSSAPIYGFIDWQFIRLLGLNHLYNTWWFFSLLLCLGISLISCTITRQFPLLNNAKEYFFKKKKNSFLNLNFFIRLKNIPYLKEQLLLKIQTFNFYTYQKRNLIYGYKGLIGRISPILVHFSLILILLGSFFGAFHNFKVQEILPKGETFHIQNTLRIGALTNLPSFNIRVNDFWAEYQNNRIHQFYSNLSILDNLGNELEQKTISVNNPLRYKNVDFYQSDWNLLGLRIKDIEQNKIYELPIFSLKENQKSWITLIPMEENFNSVLNEKKNSLNSLTTKKSLTLIFDQFENTFFVYNQEGKFLSIKNIGDFITPNLKILELLPSTGLLIKYDPSIILIYLGFGLLMITTFLSYLPYTQLWIFNKGKQFWIGCSTNRGKIQLEVELETFLRNTENSIKVFNK